MVNTIKVVSALWLLILSFLLPVSVWADAGERKVRFAGNLSEDASQRISVKALESKFSLHTAKIYNPWDKKTAEYTGIWLSDLVARQAKPNTQLVRFKAIDDYQVEINRDTWQAFRILVVTQEEGRHLPVSNKGPMRLVFPDYDAANKEYELNLPLWMWMITKIEFE